MLFLVMSINISDLTIKIAVITVIGKFFGDSSKTEKGIKQPILSSEWSSPKFLRHY